MPDPAELLAVARLLSNASAPTPPSDARLRRAVSTAYYAVFHMVLGIAARRFMGPDQEHTAGYALIYRGFDHGRMKDICGKILSPTLSARYQILLRKTSVSQDMRDFAKAFPAIQEARHLADYDPMTQFLPSDVSSLIDSAEVARAAFDRVEPAEQADVLALMMVGGRA